MRAPGLVIARSNITQYCVQYGTQRERYDGDEIWANYRVTVGSIGRKLDLLGRDYCITQQCIRSILVIIPLSS